MGKYRGFIHDASMGPKNPHSTVLTAEERKMIIDFRKRTGLALDDCLYSLQKTIPKLTRSSLYRLFETSWDESFTIFR